MRLSTTDTQETFRGAVRDFAERELAPRVEELDRKAEFPWDIFQKSADRGLAGPILPEKYGGQAMDNVSYMIMIEELSRIDPGFGVTHAVHTSVGVYPILRWGTEEQKDRYLPGLTSGKLAGFALTEPNAGSDAVSINTVAEADGDDYVINGAKVFITNGEGHVFVVMAKTDRSAGARGITAFILDKDMEGFRHGQKEDKLGIRSSSTTELIMEDVRVPKENVLGEPGQGFKIAMQTLDNSRMGIGAQGVGIAQGAYEAALAYSKERQQFGKPISRFQAIQFMLADMATGIDASRLLVYRAADIKDKGKPFANASAMSKLFATDTAMDSVTKAIQVHGGHGYVKGAPVERFFRDAKVTQIYEGTNEIHRMVIARHLLS